MSRTLWRDLGLLSLAAGLSLFSFLGRPPIHRVQEARVLEVAREMRESGDLLVPRFCGRERFEKPPLAYWLAWAGFAAAGGRGEAAGRFFSAFAGLLTVILVYSFGRSLGRPRLGLWGGLILASSILFTRLSRHAETDGLMACFTTAAFYCFWRSFEAGPEEKRAWRGWTALGWGALALACLSKQGGLIVLLPVAIYLAAAGRWSGFGRLFYPPALLLFLAVSGPWFIQVVYQERAAAAVFRTELETVAGGWDHGKDSVLYAVSFYFLRIWPDFAPWSPFLFLALLRAPFRVREERGLSFLLAWAGGCVLQLELMGNKQPHYMAAALPALALLSAWWLESEAGRLAFLPAGWAGRFTVSLAAVMCLSVSLWAFFGRNDFPPQQCCRDFALETRRIARGAPVYFLNQESPEADFYLDRVVRVVGPGREPLEPLLDSRETFFLIARQTQKDGSPGGEELLAAHPRFRLVHTAAPHEMPLRLYQALPPLGAARSGAPLNAALEEALDRP